MIFTSKLGIPEDSNDALDYVLDLGVKQVKVPKKLCDNLVNQDVKAWSFFIVCICSKKFGGESGEHYLYKCMYIKNNKKKTNTRVKSQFALKVIFSVVI